VSASSQPTVNGSLTTWMVPAVLLLSVARFDLAESACNVSGFGRVSDKTNTNPVSRGADELVVRHGVKTTFSQPSSLFLNRS